MKRSIRLFALSLFFAVAAPLALASVFEPWSVLDSANIGTYQDTNGSIIMFLTTDGPKAGERALKIESTLKGGGYCGIWHNIAANLSKAGAIKFMAKSTKSGEVQISLKDKYNMQYITFVQIPSNEWSEVTVNIASFKLDPFYTPPDAIKGHDLDVSEAKGINFGPKMEGDATILIGPLYTGDASSEKPKAAAPAPAEEKPAAKPAEPKPAAKPAAPKPVAKPKPAAPKTTGPKVVLQGFSVLNDSISGTWKDEKGSWLKLAAKGAPTSKNPNNKTVAASYHQVADGYCGFWFRAGENWDGVDASGPKSLQMRVTADKPMVLGVTLKDVDGNEINVVTPKTQSGQWQTLTVAIEDAPAGFGKVKVFHVYPRNPGADGSFEIDWLQLVK